jgi:hypothetical protein
MDAKSDLPQRTLDLLILKAAALGLAHDDAIAQWLRGCRGRWCRFRGARFIGRCTGWKPWSAVLGIERGRDQTRSRVLSLETQGP